ncbi:MAG: ribonuclease III [Oscillospiraceae bacterium]|nr:ribonuclease III [Oscillospiraceae bacterium]
MSEQDINRMSVLALAQVGDAVYELMARTALCLSQPTAKKLHKARVEMVNAAAQSRAAQTLMPLLTDAEMSVFKRGRNADAGNIPSAATRGEYMAATGLEALWGYLYLSGQTGRLSELFEAVTHEKDG